MLALVVGIAAASRGSDCAAAAPTGRGGGFRIDSWTTDQGLPSDSVVGVLQTRDGYIWISTNAGLARFDGVRFVVFNSRNTPELASDGCGRLLEDRGGALWIPTMGGGITRLAGGRFIGYGKADGLSLEYVTVMLEDRAGRVWIGSNDKLHVFEQGRFASVGPEQGLAAPRPQPLFEDDEGSIWLLGADGQVGRWRDGNYRPWHAGEAPLAGVDGPFYSWPGRDGSQWIVQSQPNRLVRLRGTAATAVDVSRASPGDRVYRVLETRRGDVWIAMTESGLRLLPEGVAPIPSLDVLSGLITALTEDREGNIWVGTRAGLNRIKPKTFAMLAGADGLADERAWAVYEDSRGDVWIGTDSVLCRRHDGQISCYGTADGLAGYGPVSLVEDRQGRLWIGTTGGLSCFADGRFVNYRVRDGLSHDNVRALYEDRQGRLWIGTSAGGLNVYENGRFRAYTVADGLAANWVRYIHQDAAGDLWICTTGGVSRLRDGTITTFTTADGLSDDRVLTVHEAADGALWFGTYRKGLCRYKGGRFTTITAADGLIDDTILHILEDARGDLWISSSRGVFRVSRRALDDFADGRSRRVESVGYGKTDGLATTDCGGGTQPAGWKMRDGHLWFPTSRGVAIVDPGSLAPNTIPPPVLVEKLTYDGVEAALGGEAVLPPGTKSIELSYTALSFAAPEKVRFRYRLDGFQPDWVDAGTRRVAYYTQLSPGAYRFHVLAANDDGVWNESGASYDFRVQPHFYRTAWFYAACALLVAAAAWSIHRLRLRQTEARYAAVLGERGRIARELHDTVAQGFAGVSMQLEAVAARMIESPAQARENLDRARLLIRTSLADARRTVRDLRPTLLESGDLATSLRRAASALDGIDGMRVEVTVKGSARRIAPAVEDQLFRVGQEALTNAVRHGRSRAVRIGITYHRHSIELVVEDDGTGFAGAPPPSRDGGGLGLVGMRERMEQIGGRLEVESSPGHGTRVRAVAPVGEAAKGAKA